MKVVLRKGKEKSLLRRHPWVFSGAIDRVEGKPAAGETVEVLDSAGKLTGMGQFSPHSQIRVRMLAFGHLSIDREFIAARIHEAISRRAEFHREGTAARLVYSESDLLPGLIVDAYAGHYVVQYLSAGMEFWKDDINEILLARPDCLSLYERSDSGSRFKEGLEKRNRQIGESATPALVEVREGNFRYLVDIRRGHKTGMYLDQRRNREIVAEYSRGKKILNCFSYTGGFSLAALGNGAESTVNIDTSADALGLFEKSRELGHLHGHYENICADVFDALRKFRDEKKKFDMIILDPPKFAESAQQVNKAARGYKDINRIAFELLKPGGMLATFSCSGHIIPELFQKIVADAAVDAGKNVQVVEFLGQSPDHPVLLSFPEAEYLKGILCRVI